MGFRADLTPTRRAMTLGLGAATLSLAHVASAAETPGGADAEVERLVSETARAVRPPRRGLLPYCQPETMERLPGISEARIQAAASDARRWLAQCEGLSKRELG